MYIYIYTYIYIYIHKVAVAPAQLELLQISFAQGVRRLFAKERDYLGLPSCIPPCISICI